MRKYRSWIARWRPLTSWDVTGRSCLFGRRRLVNSFMVLWVRQDRTQRARWYRRRLKHRWVRPSTGADPKLTVMERRLVVPLLADRIGRREDALVYRTRFSNQASPLKLGLWNKSNDLTHVLLQIWRSVFLDDEHHSNEIGRPTRICTSLAAANG